MLASSLLSMLYCTGAALMAVSAMYWPLALGPLAASPGILLMATCTLLLPFTRVRRSYVTARLKVRGLLALGLASSVLSVTIFGWSPLYAGKFVSLAVLTLVWVSPLLMLDVLQIRHLRIAMAAGIALCLVGYVFSDLFPGALPAALRDVLFQGIYADYGDERPRGFTEEPSSFSTTLARFLLIYYLIWEARRPFSGPRLIAVLCAIAGSLVVLGSKGAVAGIAVAMLAVSAGRRQWAYMLVLAPLAIATGATQLLFLQADLEQFTSTSTRLGMALTGVAATLLNPLGWGYYGFYGAVERFGGWSMTWMSERLPLLFTEMASIIEELSNVSTKSTLLDFSMVLGWPFLLMLWRVGKFINLRDPRARAMLAYLLLTSFTTSGNLSILAFLGLAVLIKLYPSAAARRLPVPMPSAQPVHTPSPG